mmetsp:Transcript_5641/g.4852  ORF Transcript_5641/g.4852 Transcript_5641/m.4852 type:complete len:122 (-) Transcript_5641:17-382(-)
MLLPKLINLMKKPESSFKNRKFHKQRTKSAKPKATARTTLTKAITMDITRKYDIPKNRKDGYRRSLDLCLKDLKHHRHRTPKHKNKYLSSIHNQRQKSSVNVSVLQKFKKYNRNNIITPYT